MPDNYDVVVTGSSGKVGQAVCYHLEHQGRKVMRASRADGGWDLTDPDAVHQLFGRCRAPYLVNCFGLNDKMSDEHEARLSVSSFARHMEVNVTALYNVCREWSLGNQSKDADHAIVNFSSIYGVVAPDPDCYTGFGAKSPGYCVSKAAVIGLTKYLSMNLAFTRTNCIVLGPLYDEKIPDEFVARMEKRHPTRVFADAHEVAALVKYMCSENSCFMNGSIVTLDGGYTAV